MAIGVNDSKKEVIKGGKLYTGIANMQVMMINPTKEQLSAAGFNPTKEPEYSSLNDNGKEKIRLDIYLQNVNLGVRAKVAFWLENEKRQNKDKSKDQWINKYGVSCWSAIGTQPSYTWFKMDGARTAYIGEELLVNFIKAWGNVDQEGQAVLDDPEALAKGDLKELVALHEAIKTNEVQCLLGVREGKYQDVYTKYFDRPYRKAFNQWTKQLEGEYSAYDADFQNDLHFKLWEGGTISADSPSDLNKGNEAPSTQTPF